MTDYEKDEFWKALARLYDETVEMRKNSEKDREKILALLQLAEKDGENIRSLAHIAEIHERRITAIEGGAEPAP